MDKKYIVISATFQGTQRMLNCVINCDYDAILRYVERLTFKEEVTLLFYSVESLNYQNLITLPDLNMRIEMNNLKALGEFKDEVIALLDKLEIKEDKGK
jgi:hypothetical protein